VLGCRGCSFFSPSHAHAGKRDGHLHPLHPSGPARGYSDDQATMAPRLGRVAGTVQAGSRGRVVLLAVHVASGLRGATADPMGTLGRSPHPTERSARPCTRPDQLFSMPLRLQREAWQALLGDSHGWALGHARAPRCWHSLEGLVTQTRYLERSPPDPRCQRPCPELSTRRITHDQADRQQGQGCPRPHLLRG
jgi:hypothetical protein